MSSYIGIIEHKDMVTAYSWYSSIFNNQITIYGNHKLSSSKFLNKNVIVKKDNIGEQYSRWYEIQRYMVCESTYIDRLAVNKNFLLILQCKIFKSDKVLNFYKQSLSNIEYLLLRDKVLAQKEGDNFCFLLPYLHSYKILAKSYLKNDEYRFSFVLTCLYVLYGAKQFAGSIIKSLLIKPVFFEKIKGVVLKKLSWGFGGKGLKDDMLIDDISVMKKDFIYYYESYSSKKIEKELYNQARESGFSAVAIDKRFNMNDCYYKAFKNNFIFATVLYILSLFMFPYLLFSLKEFNSKTFTTFKIYSFVDVEKFWSVGNWHDIAETVVANNQQVRTFMYSWSDYSQSYLYPFTYTVQDDVFMWGSMEEKYMVHKSLHENMYTIGCLFSNNFIEEDKEKVFNSLHLDSSKPLVVFYDSPVSNAMRFPQDLFDRFRKIVLLFEKKYPSVQVVLKPKTVTDEYKDYFRKTSVKLLDSRDVYLGDIINISTLNIGMGIVAPITISLLMNKQGIFFDTAGNYDSPFAKYEGNIIFRDEEGLLKKIDQIIAGQTIALTEIKELSDYNVPDANPVEILRKYIKTGNVDEKYKLDVL